jgi:hypothetical protein
MSDAEIQSVTPAMTTGKAVAIYAGSVVALFALMALGANIPSFPGFVVFLGYLALGFLLNRIVLRGLIEWHPVYSTLSNVSSAKLGMLTLWPIRYPALFFKLLVAKHL